MPFQYKTISSGKLSATATVVTGSGGLKGIGATTDAVNDATVTIYDNTSAAGTVLWEFTVLGAQKSKYFAFPHAVAYNTGLRVVLTTVGTADYFVHYELG